MVSLSNHEWTTLRQAQGEREIDDEAKTKSPCLYPSYLVCFRSNNIRLTTDTDFLAGISTFRPNTDFSAKAGLAGFNGAATFQSRKPGQRVHAAGGRRRASMGPRPFSHGNDWTIVRDT